MSAAAKAPNKDLVKELASLSKRQATFEDKILEGALTPELFDYYKATAQKYAEEAAKVRGVLLTEGGFHGNEEAA